MKAGIGFLVLLMCLGFILFGLSMGGVIGGDAPAPPTPTPASGVITNTTAPVVTPPAVTPPAVTPPPPPTGAAFTTGAAKNSGFNDDGNGNAVYLDRHSLGCGDNSGIQYMRLMRNQADYSKFRYDFNCTSGGSLNAGVISKSTPANDDGNGNTVHLDRHDVSCDPDSVINYLRLVRVGPDWKTYKYDYSCAKSSKPLTCRNVSTEPTEDGGGDSRYLDRQSIGCNPDEAINQLRLTRIAPEYKKYKYDYKCCK
jgi:hypothetical protein